MLARHRWDQSPKFEVTAISLSVRVSSLNLIRFSALTPSEFSAIVFLVLVTFWLPPQSEMKISIAACTILIITAFLLYFGFKVPLTANPPLIGNVNLWKPRKWNFSRIIILQTYAYTLLFFSLRFRNIRFLLLILTCLLLQFTFTAAASA